MSKIPACFKNATAIKTFSLDKARHKQSTTAFRCLLRSFPLRESISSCRPQARTCGHGWASRWLHKSTGISSCTSHKIERQLPGATNS